MLVLTRKVREGLWIGDNVFIAVLSIQRGRVKLGIEAPENIKIDREELRPPDERALSQQSKPRSTQDESDIRSLGC